MWVNNLKWILCIGPFSSEAHICYLSNKQKSYNLLWFQKLFYFNILLCSEPFIFCVLQLFPGYHQKNNKDPQPASGLMEHFFPEAKCLARIGLVLTGYIQLSFFFSLCRSWSVHCQASQSGRGRLDPQLITMHRMWLWNARKQPWDSSQGNTWDNTAHFTLINCRKG